MDNEHFRAGYIQGLRDLAVAEREHDALSRAASRVTHSQLVAFAILLFVTFCAVLFRV